VTFMTSPRATTSLSLDQDFFDSAETETLSTAFVKAWAFVEFDPTLALWDASERQAQCQGRDYRIMSAREGLVSKVHL
jgi:hypothetical protein